MPEGLFASIMAQARIHGPEDILCCAKGTKNSLEMIAEVGDHSEKYQAKSLLEEVDKAIVALEMALDQMGH